MKKFKDNAVRLSDIRDYSIVSCPKCSKPVDFKQLKVTCPHCGYHKRYEPIYKTTHSTLVSTKLDDYLQISCCGHTLWATNIEHLDYLEAYVSADQRERIPIENRSLASRLPQWIKNKKNRKDILKAITKLRQKLKANNYIPTP